ncbi:MAG TPA: winged helix-turn-helix domain-containing protein [Bryobacteraceae bacterium]|jgi:TolB-like protein/DNA-binding winged helix-turn-helix (wHTH) protein/Tfp pilus assembly protein PilF|nr:winged helix-turn-helix domain-containing protein [Bryobacteraceae bacterium]
MAEQTQKPVVRFGVFEASLLSGELRKHGLLIRVPGQPFKILAIFLERPGEVITRDELRKSLWPAETFVDFEHSLNSAIKKLRESLGDSAESPRYIETLPRVGYRFIAPVSAGDPEAGAPVIAGNLVYQFGAFRLDPRRRLLLTNNQPVPLQPKAFETLLTLVQNSDKVIPKEDLMKAVWPDTFVEEPNLTENSTALRRALGDTAAGPRYMEVRTITEPEAVIAEDSVGAMSPATPGGETPRRYRPNGSLVVAGAVAIALVFCWLAWRRFGPAPPQVPARVMLAVLPFQNLSGDPEQEYFADGLTEEMITQLGRLQPERLGVIARTSVMAYKHSDKRLDQIGREIGVQYVLEGSFRRYADRLRITAQLIHVKDQTHLWAEEYDRWSKDLVAVQGEVAVAIARQIQLQLTPQQRAELNRPRLIDPQTHEEYLRGRFFYNQRTGESMRKAVEYFQTAIARDPAYGEAYASLAHVYDALAAYSFEAPNEVLPKAKAAARKALAYDDRADEAYVVLGLVSLQYDRNWAESERNFKRAIEVSPNEPMAHHAYGSTYLAAVGRLDESLVELRKAHELDPLSPIITVAIGASLWYPYRKPDAAMEQFRKTFDIAPHFDAAHYFIARGYAWTDSYREALAELEKIESPDNVPAIGLRGYIYAAQGRTQQDALLVVNQLKQLSKRSYVDPMFIANIYAGLGYRDSSFLWLERAYDQHSLGMMELRLSPAYAKIRSDSRFAGLVRRVGIP